MYDIVEDSQFEKLSELDHVIILIWQCECSFRDRTYRLDIVLKIHERVISKAKSNQILPLWNTYAILLSKSQLVF